jgi:capsular exopolysaccharide synthesis family protein
MVISITSTIAGEGKSTLSSNLASMIALTNRKVIILDLDMRKPNIHNFFNLPNQYGMSTLLTNSSVLEDVTRTTINENLSVITSGPIPPNPSELLASEEIYNVINSLKKIYDVIILDTPPIGLVTDTIHLIDISDVTLYVVRSKFSKKPYLHNIERMSRQYKMKGLSLVLYGVENNQEGYGYYK